MRASAHTSLTAVQATTWARWLPKSGDAEAGDVRAQDADQLGRDRHAPDGLGRTVFQPAFLVR